MTGHTPRMSLMRRGAAPPFVLLSRNGIAIFRCIVVITWPGMIRKKPTKIQGSIGLKQKSLLTTVFHDRPRIHLTRQFPHSSSEATFLTVSSSLAPDSSRPPPPPSSHRSLEKMCRRRCPLTWRRCRRHTWDIDESWSRVKLGK
jgi:hypothetical protein